MESISLTLIILSFLENFILATLIYSLLSIKKFDHRFFIMIVLLTITLAACPQFACYPFSNIFLYSPGLCNIFQTSV